MSGGSLDYFYCSLEDHTGDFGDKELDELVKDLAKLFHDREWFLSGDTCEGAWREAKDNFKKKWFTDYGRKDRVEAYLNEVRREVFDMLSMEDELCSNCSHWRSEKNNYGKCDVNKSYLMHRFSRCDKERFEPRREDKEKLDSAFCSDGER